MVKLIRDNKTGDYITEDKRFRVERRYSGWDVLEYDSAAGNYENAFSVHTLKEVREFFGSEYKRKDGTQ